LELKPETLFELAPDAVVGVGRGGLIALVNAQTEALFGYARAELLGQPLETLLPARFRDVHVAHGDDYFKDPRTRPMGASLELFARRRDGSEFPAEISLSSMETPEGTLAIAAVRDVSERMALIRERERLQSEAEHERLSNRHSQVQRLESLGELAGGIAHDFNNLLAVIINYAAFVAEDLSTAASTEIGDRWEGPRDDVEQIKLAAEQAAHLTRQLLAFARRDAVKPEVVDVNEIVGHVEQLLGRTLGEHVQLLSSLGAELWPVLIDPGQLEQILLNLAINARDAMPDGGMLRVETANVDVDEAYASGCAELSPGCYVRLQVSDSGRGMSRESAQRAFDPFFTTKPPGKGTGLGLATVYGIVQRAGGCVQIYSEPGVGTTVTALLPATGQASAVPELRIDPARLRGQETILLVEDEASLRRVAQRILSEAGYTVIAAANGPDALVEVGRHPDPIDLLLTDVIMPQMPGPQLAERLLAQRPTVRVLFMSGFAEPLLGSRGFIDGDIELLDKPFAASDLLEKVGQVLQRNGGAGMRTRR
jgi:PAS domain S-box-containing protein